MAKRISGLNKKSIWVDAYSVGTVEYYDIRPNYFRVQNLGDMNILCSTSSIPNKDRYDFLAPASGAKMYTEPTNRDRLYIFNPSGSPIQAVVLAFEAEFDPLTLALAEISLDIGAVNLEASNVIAGFDASLPSGNNVIGKVILNESLPAGSQKIGSVDVANQKDYTSNLTAILNAIGNIQISGGGGSAAVVNHKCLGEGITVENAGTTVDLSSHNVVKVNFLSNDGTESIRVTITQKYGDPFWFELKAGEVINDLEVPANTLEFRGDDVPVRYIVTATV